MMLRTGLLTLLAGALLAGPAVAADDPAPPSIRVSAAASASAPPDRVVIDAGVVTTGTDAGSALAAGNKAMAAIRSAIGRLGIADRDVQTVAFSVQPRWSDPPRNPPAGWQSTIVGYTVEHTVAIRSAELERAGELIAAVSAAGANQIGGLRFELADTAALRARALADATRAALVDARVAAEAAGGTLGAVRHIDIQDFQPVPVFAARAAMMESAAMAAPVASGLVTVDARVSLEVGLTP